MSLEQAMCSSLDQSSLLRLIEVSHLTGHTHLHDSGHTHLHDSGHTHLHDPGHNMLSLCCFTLCTL